jgi:transposase
MTITHGDSKDHRPDWKQAVLELLVSPAGGGPCLSNSWEGHTADTQMFQERAAALIATFQRSPTPRSGVADAEVYTEDNATNLQAWGCITRIPQTIKLVSQVLTQALREDMGPRLDDPTRDPRGELCHDRMAQCWLVGSSQAALERAAASVTTAQQRAYAAIEKPLVPWHAKRLETPEAAHAALAAREQGWRDHPVDADHLIDHPRDAHKGRPTSTTPMQVAAWPMPAQVRPETETMAPRKQHHAGLVLGTTIDASQVHEAAVRATDKSQAQAEGGFRVLTDPLFVVSSLCVKQPARLQGLLMVMT